jgi:ribosomal protein L13E
MLMPAPLLRPNVRGATGRKREGKGFSLPELTAAGIDPALARSFGLAIDRRRSSVWPENIAVLRFLKTEAQKK